MKLTRRTVVAAVIAALVGGWSLSARADLLSYQADAYVGSGGGPGAGGAWYGVEPYSNTSLSGSIEWEVFLPSTFNSLFGGSSSGYTTEPTELVYAFQVENTGTSDPATVEADVLSTHLFDTPGWFNIPGETDTTQPTFSIITSSPYSYAKWSFSPGIPQGESTVGMAYSSPDAPVDDSFGSVSNAGLGANPSPLPEPSTTPAIIPEPGTAALLAFVGLMLCVGGPVCRRTAGVLTSFRV